MELLDLPPELFQRIIYLLIEDVGPVESFSVSFTCKTFSSAIHESIFELQPLGNLLHESSAEIRQLFRREKDASTNMFQRHGGQMLYSRMSRTASDDIWLSIRMTVDALLNIYGPAQDDTHERFTRSLCHAISADPWPIHVLENMANIHENIESLDRELIRSIPAAAAACGELDILRELVTCDQTLLRDGQIMPSAFGAAVAVGHVEVARWIMALLTAPDDGYEASDPDSKYNNDLGKIVRDASTCKRYYLADALETSITMFQQQVGIMLLDRALLLAESDCDCGRTCPRFSTSSLIELCIIVGNFEMLTVLLQHRNELDGVESPSKSLFGLPIDHYEWQYMFVNGSCRLFAKMLDAGQMQHNQMGTHLLLKEALTFSRFDIFLLLLARGADINACNTLGKSALQLAVEGSFAPHVQILLDKGATPTLAKLPRNNEAWPCYNLCKTAILVYEMAGFAPGSESGTVRLREVWNVLKD